jgi:hypothetical protein
MCFNKSIIIYNNLYLSINQIVSNKVSNYNFNLWW